MEGIGGMGIRIPEKAAIEEAIYGESVARPRATLRTESPRRWQNWIADEDRPGGVGRHERQRIFWERVASGRAVFEAAESAEEEHDETPSESPLQSAEVAIATMLTVVVFGLGWVTLELEGVSRERGYDQGFRTSIISENGESSESGEYSERDCLECDTP